MCTSQKPSSLRDTDAQTSAWPRLIRGQRIAFKGPGSVVAHVLGASDGAAVQLAGRAEMEPLDKLEHLFYSSSTVCPQFIPKSVHHGFTVAGRLTRLDTTCWGIG